MNILYIIIISIIIIAIKMNSLDSMQQCLSSIPKIGFGLGTKWFRGIDHNSDGSSLEQEG